MDLFSSKYGIVPACDVSSIASLTALVEATFDLDFIQGYKIGMELVVKERVNEVTTAIRKYTDLPIIYDHQKFATDIPDVCSGRILDILKEAGIDALILFPLSGIETLEATINRCKSLGLTPIVGGEMTHKGYLVQEDGYIADDSPGRMYVDAASMNAKYFIVPGTRIESMKKYRLQLEEILPNPAFLFPGVGKGQGGDIVAAFEAVRPLSAYAIVGRGIYAEDDSREAARRLWNSVESQLDLV